MGETKYTPGPWKLGSLTHKGSSIYIDAQFHTGLAKVIWLMDDDRDAGEKSPECEANARLIAAAPELLGTLKDVRKWMDADLGQWESKFVRQIDALIARVEGGQ